jgi:hypothetical protein
VDRTHTATEDFTLANTLLAPTISLLRSQAGSDMDFWKLINRLMISFYWSYLADLGQIAPTTYMPSAYSVTADFTQPTLYPPTNNIFVNNTPFQLYSSYLNDTIFPFVNYSGPVIELLHWMRRIASNLSIQRLFEVMTVNKEN